MATNSGSVGAYINSCASTSAAPFPVHRPTRHLVEEDRQDNKVVDTRRAGRLSPQPYYPRPREECPNLVRLIRIPDSIPPLLCMKCMFDEPGASPILFQEEAETPRLVTMSGILTLRHCQIASIVFNSPSQQTSVQESAIVDPMVLPFSPSAVTSEHHPGGPPYTMPHLPKLTELSITIDRGVSPRSLLQFLEFTPALQTLSICASDRPVYPEDCRDMPTVDLPCLQSVMLEGLLANAVDEILSKLALNTSTKIDIHLGPFSPSWSSSTLRSALSRIQDARISYTAQEVEGSGEAASRSKYLFKFSDVDSRVQVHWEWDIPHVDTPNLLHVRLDLAPLANVQMLTILLEDVTPLSHQWIAMLKPFPLLRRLDLSVTRADAQTALARGQSTASFKFKVRATPLLQKVMDISHVFGLGLPGYIDPGKLTTTGATSTIPGSSLRRKLYSGAWRYMVHKSG
ncbi:hypothetical protein C8Q78DRAFT_365364 [Trametes maxima]|nr:hypothetical protein C8Q78DRAFT_365364 [Trametes maxima]